MSTKREAFKKTVQPIIKWLEKRNMEGFYFDTAAEAVQAMLEMMPEGSVVAHGGSASFAESGMLDAIKAKNYTFIDRASQNTRENYVKAILSDYYFMGTNAITLKGELINIDGNANRVGCLCHGPSNVFIFAGMNKVVADVESGIKRIRTYACPPNAHRLNRNTPCGNVGVCGDCLLDDCFCNQIVITRRSGHKGRIKVFLIGEELGF